MAHFALAFGTATKNRDGKIIEAFFPSPVLNPSDALLRQLRKFQDIQKATKRLKSATNLLVNYRMHLQQTVTLPMLIFQKKPLNLLNH